MSTQITFSVPADEYIRDFVESDGGTAESGVPVTCDTPEPAAAGRPPAAVPAHEMPLADSYIEDLLSRQPLPAGGPALPAGSASIEWRASAPHGRRSLRRFAVVAAALGVSAGAIIAMVAAEGAPAARRGQRVTLARSDTSTAGALANLPNRVTRAAATDVAGLLERIDARAGHRRVHASHPRRERTRRRRRVIATKPTETGVVAVTRSQPTTPTDNSPPVDTSPASRSTTSQSTPSSSGQSSAPRPAFGLYGVLGPGHSPSG